MPDAGESGAGRDGVAPVRAHPPSPRRTLASRSVRAGLRVRSTAMRFDGVSAIVTGAGSGIGSAASCALAAEGASVVLCGRRPEALERTRIACASLSATGALAVPLDVRDEHALRRAFDEAASLAPLGAAVACHGINRLARAEEMPAAVWNEVVSTNLTGAFLFAREAARRMRPAGRGRIAIVSSVSGRPGYSKFPGFAAYAASKYALTGLVEVLAVELAGCGVGIAGLCPGGVDTELFRDTFPGSTPGLTPERVAEALLDLLDPLTAPPSGSLVDLV